MKNSQSAQTSTQASSEEASSSSEVVPGILLYSDYFEQLFS